MNLLFSINCLTIVLFGKAREVRDRDSIHEKNFYKNENSFNSIQKVYIKDKPVLRIHVLEDQKLNCYTIQPKYPYHYYANSLEECDPNTKGEEVFLIKIDPKSSFSRDMQKSQIYYKPNDMSTIYRVNSVIESSIIITEFKKTGDVYKEVNSTSDQTKVKSILTTLENEKWKMFLFNSILEISKGYDETYVYNALSYDKLDKYRTIKWAQTVDIQPNTIGFYSMLLLTPFTLAIDIVTAPIQLIVVAVVLIDFKMNFGGFFGH